MARIVFEIEDDDRDVTCVIKSDCEMPRESARMTGAQRLASYLLFYVERFGGDKKPNEAHGVNALKVH